MANHRSAHAAKPSACRGAENPRVGGSIPSVSTFSARTERTLATGRKGTSRDFSRTCVAPAVYSVHWWGHAYSPRVALERSLAYVQSVMEYVAMHAIRYWDVTVCNYFGCVNE